MVSVDWSPTTMCGMGNTNATVCYDYNALGQRVQATFGGNSYHDIEDYLFDPNGDELANCEGAGVCWYGSYVRWVGEAGSATSASSMSVALPSGG